MQEPRERKTFNEHVLHRLRMGNWCPRVQGFMKQEHCNRTADPRNPDCRDCPRREVGDA